MWSTNVNASSPFEIYLKEHPARDGNTLSVVGTVRRGAELFAALEYNHFTYFVFGMFAVAVLLAIFLILLPLEKIETTWNTYQRKRGKAVLDLNRTLSRVMFFLTPFFCYFMIGKIAGQRSLSTMLRLISVRGLLNLMIIGLIWWLIYTCCNRVKWSTIATTGVAFFFGLMNFILILFRDSPLIFSDIANTGTGIAVMGTYHVTFNKASLWAILLTTIWICLALNLKGHRGLTGKKRLAAVLLAAIWAGGFYYVIFQSSVIENYKIKVSGFKPKFNYRKNGYVLSFFVTMKTSFVQEPKDYSVEQIKKTMAQYPSDRATKIRSTTRNTPNIIAIMDEAYSDLHAVGNFPTIRIICRFIINWRRIRSKEPCIRPSSADRQPIPSLSS